MHLVRNDTAAKYSRSRARGLDRTGPIPPPSTSKYFVEQTIIHRFSPPDFQARVERRTNRFASITAVRTQTSPGELWALHLQLASNFTTSTVAWYPWWSQRVELTCSIFSTRQRFRLFQIFASHTLFLLRREKTMMSSCALASDYAITYTWLKSTCGLDKHFKCSGISLARLLVLRPRPAWSGDKARLNTVQDVPDIQNACPASSIGKWHQSEAQGQSCRCS